MKKTNKTQQDSQNFCGPAAPERRVVNDADAHRMTVICTDSNSSRMDSRNFKCLEFRGIRFNGANLSGIETHYSRFTDCEFEACELDRMEGHFAEFENCTFTNCDLNNGNFSFARFADVKFFNCNLNGVDLPFAHGKITCRNCMMEHCTAPNADLEFVLTQTNARSLEANFAHLVLDISDSNLRYAEFNDSSVKGAITRTDLTNAEFNRADLTELQLVDCAVSNIETENAVGFEDPSEDLASIFDDEE